MPRLLNKYQPGVVVLELGGNDGLRGIDISVTRHNLASMIEQSQAIGAKVILAGIKLPPNYGVTYTEGFYATYTELETEYGLLLIPFFMEAVAYKPEFMQDDGIHPNADGQPLLLDAVWPLLEPMLE